ncbi:Peroxisome chaperone and import receptor [Sporothrix curviconia]|uniref:Peroxisome chaperone and import receptor n=1 Tax=Sporothrix curviconia TaxID=1260050 RepID=A0ABP0AVR5_9PEZI
MDDTMKVDVPVVVPEATTAEAKQEESKPVETRSEEVKAAETTTTAPAEEANTGETITPAATSAPPAADVDDAMEDVPDPDEDDLDDLDDLLDDFSAAKIDSKAPATAAPAAAAAAPPAIPAPALPPGIEDDADMEALLNDEDFAKQLQAGMADLIGEIEKSPDVQAQFESLFKEFGVAADGSGGNMDLAAAAAAATGQVAAAHVAAQTPPPTKAAPKASASSSKSVPAPAAVGDASFQDTIRRTMERMQASGDQATAAAAADSENTDDMLSEFMKQLQSGGLGGPGGGNEEDLTKMLMGMMEELTNKEILYEPMKELDDKFPAWMEANRSKTSAEDLKRYEEQQVIVREIVARFELPSYSDTNPEHREYIADRMQKMQAAGSPPPDLVGDMPSAQEALAVPDESCNQQ